MAIETLAKRSFPGIVLALLATTTSYQGQGLSQLVGLALSGSPRAGALLGPRHDASPPDAEPKSGQAILERNPFDSVTGPFPAEPPLRFGGAPRANGVEASDPLSSPTCQGVQVLIVTESSDPWWSLATLREPGESRARLRRVGDAVAGRQVAFIGYNPKQQAPAVWMQGGGSLCQAMLFRAQAPDVERATTLERGPAAVDKHLEHPPSSFSTLRFVPDRRDGKLLGLRLFGIRPGSLLGTLGLQNGDRLESINGFDIASPQRALEAYARLSTAKRLNVRVVRLGRPLQIDLNII